MAKPTTKPDFVSTANLADTTYAVTPSAARIASGWARNERPAAHLLNFLLGWLTKWIDHYDLGLAVVTQIGGTTGDEVNSLGADWIKKGNWVESQAAGANGFAIQIPIEVGRSMTEVRAMIKGHASFAVTFKLYKYDNTGTATQLANTQAGTAAATDQTLTINAADGGAVPLPVTIEATRWYEAVFDAGAQTGVRIYGIEVVHSRP